MTDWNRKDCSANETIKTITNILKSISSDFFRFHARPALLLALYGLRQR